MTSDQLTSSPASSPLSPYPSIAELSNLGSAIVALYSSANTLPKELSIGTISVDSGSILL